MEKTVIKALRVLEVLAHSTELRGASELARHLNLTRSNAHRLLETLCHNGYVRKFDGGKYGLSLKLWQLGALTISRLDIKRVSAPYMEALRRSANETVHLTVFVEDHAVYVEQLESDHPVRTPTRIGASLPAHCTATGKVLLAHQPPAVIDAVAKQLTRYTANTIAKRSDLLVALKNIREQGFAINIGEWHTTVNAAGAPIYNSAGQVSAALGISGPADRLSRSTLRAMVPAIRDAAMKISVELGLPLDSPILSGREPAAMPTRSRTSPRYRSTA